MQAVKLLHKWLGRAVSTMHSTRLSSLLAHVEGLLIGQRLGLTAVGRHVRGKTREKDKIKRADRLVGNPHLTGERRAVYGWIVRLLVGGARHPHLIVDWSEVEAARTLFLLRARWSLAAARCRCTKKCIHAITILRIRVAFSNACGVTAACVPAGHRDRRRLSVPLVQSGGSVRLGLRGASAASR